MFKGYERAKLDFEMLPDILPNQESHFEECSVSYVVDPTSSNDMVDPSKALP